MFNIERTIELAELDKQTENFWWAASNIRGGHHSGAYWVLRVLRKSARTERLRYRATKVLEDQGYTEHVTQAEW